KYYLAVMKRLRDSIRKKRPNLWRDSSWYLHHDNAPARRMDLVLYVCVCSRKLPLRGRRFDSIEEIQKNSLNELKAISESGSQEIFEDWKNRWHKCVVVHGEYFKGD
ncbi:hypothetical protein ALC57_14877, partial [Trachymyrmex cornetzi]